MSPVVSVVIPHHDDRVQPYVKLCIKSLMAQVGVDFEVILISDAETDPNLFIPHDQRLRMFHDKSLDTVAKKYDFGYQNSHPDSKFIIIGNDDVLLNKHALRFMVETTSAQKSITNGMGTSDNTAAWVKPLIYQNPETKQYVELKTSMSIDDLKGTEEKLIEMEPIFKDPLLIPQEWVPSYFTCVAKDVYGKLGGFDENLSIYGNDVDWCRRARDIGVRCCIDMRAFLVHFQHKTTQFIDDLQETKDLYETQKKYLVEKTKKAYGIN